MTEALVASMKKVICSSGGLGSLVGVGEAEAVLESFNEDFVAFELHMSFSESFCCVLNPHSCLDDGNLEHAFH